jgi:hypothetical protein
MGLAIASSFELRLQTGLVRRGLAVARRLVFPTGLAPLDRALPDGGLPEGAITELCGRRAAGKLTLALAIAANALGRGDAAALIDSSATVVPTLWAHPALERLLVVRGGGATTALRAADALLKTGAFPLLVLDLPGRAQVTTAALVRLAHETRTAGTVLLLVSEWLPWRTHGLASLGRLRLEVQRLDATRFAVTLGKSKLGNTAARALVDLVPAAGRKESA